MRIGYISGPFNDSPTLDIKKVKLVFFSPTGTGKKTIGEIAKGTRLEIETIDLTSPKHSTNYKLEKEDLAIFSVPVYGGRIPQLAIDRLKSVKGDNTPAVLVVLYGNRAYEDALLELHNTTKELGFKTVAGAAFIGQHSFNSEESPIAVGRPDHDDLQKAYDFGAKVIEKIRMKKDIEEIKVPGNYPYRERGRGEPRCPETNEDTCILCGLCARVCPSGCIKVSDKVETQVDSCIACTACVQNCPTGARSWTHPGILRAAKWLSTEHGDRKEVETFL